MITLLIFLLVLSVLVFVHEFGHFITAKRAKLRVDEFGFGFPPRVVGLQKINGRRRIVWGTKNSDELRDGGTVYSLNLLPFGGFVKIKGESGEGLDEQDSFASRGAPTRIAIIVAGVFMNFVLAVVLIAVGFVIGFPQVLEGEISKYAHIKDQHIEVLGVLSESPAEKAGVRPGMRVISGNDSEFENAEAFKSFVSEFNERSVRLKVAENGQAPQELTVTPTILEQTQKPGIGVSIADTAEVRYPFWLAIPKGLALTLDLAKTIVVSFGLLVRDAVLGRPVTADLAGPIGIAVLTGQAARMGFVHLLQFMAILSVNLAVLNIIPFPALDGGRILFILIEKALRRPVARKVEGWIHGAGFVLLLTLVGFITFRDLGRYGGKIAEFFKGLF
ncbi:MAG: site-2 protease family protein [bacterium]|nr:site-2 protease family protein [bacterium]